MSEATGPYLPIYLQMPRDPKVVDFAATLDVDRQRAVGMLLDLWVWAFGVAATDGTIRRCSAQQLAMVMEWPRAEAAYLEEALKDAEWMSRVNGDIVLHEWELYGGKVKALLQRERERKRDYRKRLAGAGDMPSPTGQARLVPCSERGTGLGLSDSASADGPRTGTRTATHSRSSRRGLKKEEEGSASAPQHAPPTPLPTWLVTFPCQGQEKSWGVTAELLAELQAIYPRVDVRAELVKCAAKVRDGAISMKTAKGMPRAIYSWLDNAVRWGSSPRQPQEDDEAGDVRPVDRGAFHIREMVAHEAAPEWPAYNQAFLAGQTDLGFTAWLEVQGG